MKRTTNYDLPTWEKDDFIRMQDFNDLTGKLDAALKSGADATAEKADGTATQRALSSLQSSIGTTGKNCRIVYGSYVGDGKYGAKEAPTSLSFDFCPAAVLVGADYGSQVTCMVRGAKYAPSLSGSTMNLTWTDNGVSWWYNGNNAGQQNNAATTYYYIALGYEN